MSSWNIQIHSKLRVEYGLLFGSANLAKFICLVTLTLMIYINISNDGNIYQVGFHYSNDLTITDYYRHKVTNLPCILLVHITKNGSSNFRIDV